MAQYIKPIIPFVGNKSLYYKYINEILDNLINHDDYIFIDCFGGSGVLSLMCRDFYINKHKTIPTIIYNDFDNYCSRIEYIPRLNKLMNEFNNIIQDKYNKKSRINEDDKKRIDSLITNDDNAITLSNYLLYMFHKADTIDELKNSPCYYNRLIKRNLPYTPTYEYFHNITIEHLDYKELINKYEEIAKEYNKTLILILDPPYISTDSSRYKSSLYNNITQLTDILQLLLNHHYIYFESEKSNVIDIIEFMNKLTKYPIYEYNSMITQRRNTQSGGTYDYIVYNIPNE